MIDSPDTEAYRSRVSCWDCLRAPLGSMLIRGPFCKFVDGHSPI